MSRHTLRPCLKQLPAAPSPFPFASSPVPSTHVHFPPTPALTSTHLTHSPHTYDRAPIAVTVNECALPERGGRTYYAPAPVHEKARGRTRRAHTPGPAPHPHAHASAAHDGSGGYFPSFAPTSAPACPILVPDQSSESDESDMVMTPPEQTHMPPSRIAATEHSARMLLLPHPPSPSDVGRGRERDRKRGATVAAATAAAVHRPQHHHHQYHHRQQQAPACKSAFAHDLELEGCLGGF